MSRRTLLIGLLILNGLMLPLGCVPTLALLAAPMTFVTNIRVTNATTRPIRLTPIGAAGVEGRRVPLPVLTLLPLAWPSGQQGQYPIPPGGSRTIAYDWDDVNLSELVVESDGGPVMQLVVDPMPTTNQYHAPTVRTFTITEAALQPAAPQVALAATSARNWPWLGLTLALMWLPWLTFVLLRRGLKGSNSDLRSRAATPEETCLERAV